MSDATDWDEERAERAAEVEAQWGHPDDHFCSRCHGECETIYSAHYGDSSDEWIEVCDLCGGTGFDPGMENRP